MMDVYNVKAEDSLASHFTNPKLRWGIGIAAALIVITIAAQILHAKHVAAEAAARNISTPLVTVIRPGVSNLAQTVTVNGTISARNDMPIGNEGDVARIAAVYVEAGDKVQKGQVLARLDPSVVGPQVGSLSAALEEAHATAELADADYKRAVGASASGAFSTEETERRRTAALSARAKVKVAAAQLAEVKARWGRTEIRAPTAGIVLTRNAEVGQTASPGGEPLFRLAQNGEIELRGLVAEQDLPKLKLGQAADVHLTGIDKPFPGKIRLLGAVIDPATRLGTVRIGLDPDPDLRPGAFARATITVGSGQRAVLPQTAVLADEKGSYVLIVGKDNRVSRQAVRVSGSSEQGMLVSEGIVGNERIVATAGAFLNVGEKVETTSTDRT
jgi:HlyD family secretion protein